jgi:hypothetical protein
MYLSVPMRCVIIVWSEFLVLWSAHESGIWWLLTCYLGYRRLRIGSIAPKAEHIAPRRGDQAMEVALELQPTNILVKFHCQNKWWCIQRRGCAALEDKLLLTQETLVAKRTKGEVPP